MITKSLQRLILLSAGLMLLLGGPAEMLGQDQAPAEQTPATEPARSVAPQTASQLDALVAPIALYPDALVAQVLAASTHPEQIAYADDWLAQNTNANQKKLADEVNEQAWDPSVKALTQFPSVLHNMARNLAWTSSLGEAFTKQQADVMAAVQRMRAKAHAAGNLKSSSQITVVQDNPSTLVIKPANPQVVYVPQYNPALVYGTPYVVPSYVPPVVVVTPSLYWSSGIAIGSGWGWGWGGFGWGFGAWNCGWGGGNVIYNNNIYINRTTNNFNGYHPWGSGGQGPGQFTPANPSSPGGYHPGGTPYTPTSGSGQSGYHPGGTSYTPPAYRPSSSYSPARSFNPQGYDARSSFDRSDLGSSYSPGVNQPRSYMSGSGFNDRAAASRGWSSMRSSGGWGGSRMGAPRSFGGFRR
jgi:Protein of unknown function (DUF3300)